MDHNGASSMDEYSQKHGATNANSCIQAFFFITVLKLFTCTTLETAIYQSYVLLFNVAK